MDAENVKILEKLLSIVSEQEKQERLAAGALTTETLSALNISTSSLPPRCSQMIQECASLLQSMGMDRLDPAAISLRQSKETAGQLAEEYELLELKQQNAELSVMFERNKKVIEDLKKELQNSKDSLASQNPNPENKQENLRSLKHKLDSLNEKYEKAKRNFTKLHIAEGILPQSIEELANRLATLKAEEASLKEKAEEIIAVREARDTMKQLKEERKMKDLRK